MRGTPQVLGGSLLVSPDAFPDPVVDVPKTAASGEQTAVLAGGCFWCVEAVYKAIDGVTDVRSGYAGGTEATANYDAVCGGDTDHAEVVQVRFDPSRTTFGQLLKVFFSIAHNPTEWNHQGPDMGRQYRSAIFVADEEQRRVAEAYIAQLDAAKVFDAPIVTEVTPLEQFFEAETYHQNYASRHPMQPYIAFHAAPKVTKLRKYFADKVTS
jgi:peptide-methionine (S)-S-oxide reductase